MFVRFVVVTLVGCLFFMAGDGATQAQENHEVPTKRAKPIVTCWYMVCYRNSVERYMEEIQLAQRHGIDAFLLDVGAWKIFDEEGKWRVGEGSYNHDKNYVDSVTRFFEAAKRLGSGFKLAMCPEAMVFRGNPRFVIPDMIKMFKDHPAYLHVDGKPFLCTYIGNIDGYEAGLKPLKEEGIDVCWVPAMGDRRHGYELSYENVLGLLQGSDLMSGFTIFGVNNTNAIMRANSACRRATLFADRIYMAGVNPHYNSSNLHDRLGMKGYGAQWESAIRDGADMISIVIWNDYNEDSFLNPGRWPHGMDKPYASRDESFLDVTGYYSSYFKRGAPPPITQDKLFVVHRARSHWLSKGWDMKNEQWIDIRWKQYPYDQVHDDVWDRVYATTFLTAPATLTIELGKHKKSVEMPAGIAHVNIPIDAGAPHFVLERGGEILLDVISRKQVIAEATKENSFLPSDRAKHLLNRTFTSGAAVGPVKRVEAESGTLHPNTEVVDIPGGKGVKTMATENSGFAVKIDGFETGTYNVRIRYSNPDPNEARLTLQADGPPRGENEYPHYMPACLPSTGEGKFATATFLWSLYDKTTEMKLVFEKKTSYDKNQKKQVDDPFQSDIGAVVVDALEFVRVEPWRDAPEKWTQTPEMVFLPGGTFTMGSDKHEPDEAPAHEVTVSSFAMGTYEVTNAEYERYAPEHKKFRDGFSWRDRDPVIYVGWQDAVKYCNWLSEKHGLSPVYEHKEVEEVNEHRWRQMQAQRQREIEKLKQEGKPSDNLPPLEKPVRKVRKWIVDMKADGFRLPTEAEWEYAASGRGENRLYPWGDEKPGPRHGNMMVARGEPADIIYGPQPASAPKGVYPVGCFPAGASRDGLLDMAGNVCEWCTDWFHPYEAGAQTDPVRLDKSATGYRAIRGGSWGFYGYSQRCSDREFNTQVYPGYTYIGFRLAINEAGWKKLNKR